MSSVIKLVLSDDEMEEARNVGLARQALNRRLGVGETHGFGGDDGEISVQGCVAGYGVAKVLGLNWRGFLRSYKGTAEVGDDIVVRSTLLRRGNLILQLDDRDDWRYVLVRCTGYRNWRFAVGYLGVTGNVTVSGRIRDRHLTNVHVICIQRGN